MFVLGNLLDTLAHLLNTVLMIYTWVLIVRVLVSWVNPDPLNQIVQFLMQITEPVLEPLRRIIPQLGPIDLSPLVALLILQGIQYFLIKTLLELALRLR